MTQSKARDLLYDKICPYCQGNLYLTGDNLHYTPDLKYIAALFTCNECCKTIAIHFKARILDYDILKDNL